MHGPVDPLWYASGVTLDWIFGVSPSCCVHHMATAPDNYPAPRPPSNDSHVRMSWMAIPLRRQITVKAFFGLELCDTKLSSVGNSTPTPYRRDPQSTTWSPTTSESRSRPSLLTLLVDIRLQIMSFFLLANVLVRMTYRGRWWHMPIDNYALNEKRFTTANNGMTIPRICV